jgi:ferritin-like metal-binding protein YciE
MVPFVGIILTKALIFMSSQISYKENRNRIKKRLSFFEGCHQLEKLEFALAIAKTKGYEKKSIVLRKKIVELGGNVEEPGT